MSSLAPAPRHGLGRWTRGYSHMIRFEVASQRDWLAFILIMQLLYGAGAALLYGFYLPTIGPRRGTFIATGTPALAVVPVGFFLLPNVVGRRKLAGSYDFVRSFPVPRSATVAATATVFTLLVIPGLVLALVISSWRYGAALHVSPRIVPAMVLASLMATSVGAAIGHGVPNPLVTTLIGNLIMFFVLLFTPIVIPPEQYPHWLVDLHKALPFYNMAVVLRDSLSTGLVTHVARSYTILALWTAGGLGLAGWVSSRRR